MDGTVRNETDDKRQKLPARKLK